MISSLQHENGRQQLVEQGRNGLPPPKAVPPGEVDADRMPRHMPYFVLMVLLGFLILLTATATPTTNTGRGSPRRHDEHLPQGLRSSSGGGGGSESDAASSSNSGLHSRGGYLNAGQVAKDYFNTDKDRALWNNLLGQRCGIDWGTTVQKQLANWKYTGITLADMDKYCVRNSARVSVVSNEIRAGRWIYKARGAGRIICSLWLIQMVALRAAAAGRKIPDVELVMQSTDGSQSTVDETLTWPDPAPLFGSIKCSKDASVSFPMGFHDQFGAFNGAMSLGQYDRQFRKLSHLDQPGWDAKERQLFFSSGAGAGSALRGHRQTLFAKQSPLMQVVTNNSLLEKYAEHRYQVYAHGRCGWSRRLREFGFMKAVVFVEDSQCEEYYLSALRPGVDYVPVAEDFSDLTGKLEAIDADPARAEAMASSWIQRARESMSLPCVLDYVELLLAEYAKLQKFTPAPRPTWARYDMRMPEASIPVHFFSRNESHLDPRLCPEMLVPGFRGSHKLTC